MSNLVGKNVLIVDEVDDTRTTLEYAVRELEKDVEAAGERVGWQGEKTRFSVFVLHVSVCLTSLSLALVLVLPLSSFSMRSVRGRR